MSFLNLRKKKTEQPEAPKHLAVKTSVVPTSAPRRTSSGTINAEVLRRPHISERASDSSAKGVYVFEVAPSATKTQIRAAVEGLYKVTVEQVRTVTVVPKRITVKGKPGVRSGGKKAYVYLKKGEKIEIV